MSRKTKRNIKRALLVIVGLLTLGALTSFVTNLVTKEENEIHPTFEVGGLDANGKYVESKDTLFTPDAIEYNEFSIKLDFDSDMKYQLYFYDENDEFVSKTEVLDSKYVDTTSSAKYVRVLLQPTWDKDVKEEDRKINVLEKVKLLNQVTICAKANEDDAEVEMISFTIECNSPLITYQCEKGMTWVDFIASDYSILEADVNSFSVGDDGKVLYNGAAIALSSSDVIEDGKNYTKLS